MFHIASSKGPPPIPEHLSAQAKDFLLLCFDRYRPLPPESLLQELGLRVLSKLYSINSYTTLLPATVEMRHARGDCIWLIDGF